MKGSLAKIVSDLIYAGTIVEQKSACIESKIIYTVECNTSYYREGAVEELDNFYWICKELRLPTHNAIAFFDAVEQNIESLRKNNKNMLKEVSITTDIELGSNDYSMETMYIIQDHIDKLLEFDYSMLPQYAKTWIEQTDFQFFYETVAKEKSSKSK